MDLTPTSKEIWKPALLLAKDGKPKEAVTLLETKVIIQDSFYVALMKRLPWLTPAMIAGASIGVTQSWQCNSH